MGVADGETVPGVVLEAPAKINAHLKVTGKRPDGYHELISVMIPVSLVDRVEVRPRHEKGIELSCTGRSAPSGEENLVWRAAHTFLNAGALQEGVSIRLHKQIPLAAGLGGGSSDAAATLLALDRIWPGRVEASTLFRLAVDLGADVPFFLEGAPALARGIGEVLERLDYWPDLWYVLVNPPVEISTAWVYGQVKIQLTTHENDYINKLLRRDGFSVAELLKNDLELVTEARYPVVKQIKRALLETGAAGALMTGSGPTVFGVFQAKSEAEAAAQTLISLDLGDVFVVENWAPKPLGDSRERA